MPVIIAKKKKKKKSLYKFSVIFLLHSIIYTTNVNLNILFSTFNSLQFKYNRNKACRRRKNVRSAIK